MKIKNIIAIFSVIIIIAGIYCKKNFNSENSLNDVEFWKRAVNEEPNSTKNRWFYASELYHSGNIRQAEIEYRLAIQRDPKSSSVKDSLGWLLYKSGRVDEARTMWQDIVRTGKNKSLIKEARKALDMSRLNK